MGQHYTLLTVSVAAYCSKCQKQTQHRVEGRRRGPCLVCIAKLEAQVAEDRAKKPQPAAEQVRLF